MIQSRAPRSAPYRLAATVGLVAACALLWACDGSPSGGKLISASPDGRVELRARNSADRLSWKVAAIDRDSGDVLNSMDTAPDPYRCAVGSAGQIAALWFPGWKQSQPIHIAISAPGSGVLVDETWEDPPPPIAGMPECRPSRFFPVILPESGDIAVMRSQRCALADRNCLADSTVRLYSGQDGRVLSESDLFDGAGPVPGKVVSATGVPGTNCIAIMLWPRHIASSHFCDVDVKEPMEFGLIRASGEVIWRDCLSGKGMNPPTDVYSKQKCWMGVGPRSFGYRNALGESRVLALKTDGAGDVISVEPIPGEPPGFAWDVPDRFKSERTFSWDLPSGGFEGRE